MPIDTIPPELLLKIFFQGIAGQEYVLAERLAAPWILTQVCRYWRSLAVVAPELWCSFAIDTEHMNHSIAQMMSTWISRSGNLPLTVALAIAPDEEGTLDEDACRSAFAVLAQYIHRWKDIHFTWSGHDLCPLADPLRHGQISTPLLEAFSLDTTMFSNGVEGPHIEAYIRRVLQDAPRLHTFVWFDTDIERRTVADWRHLSLPGARLHTLNLDCDLSPEEIVGLLAQCPVLDCADLSVAIPFNSLCEVPQALTHATLRQLHLQFTDQVTRLFDLLTLPALHDLRVSDFSNDTTDWHHEPFLNFLQRSNCALASLALSLWVNFTQETLLRTLAGLPSLEYLYVEDQKCTPPGCVGNELLHQLCHQPPGTEGFKPKLCPKLRGFGLIGVFGAAIASGLLPLAIRLRRHWFPPGIAKKYAMNTPDFWVALDSEHLRSQDLDLLRTWQHQGWLRVDLDNDYGDDFEMDWE